MVPLQVNIYMYRVNDVWQLMRSEKLGYHQITSGLFRIISLAVIGSVGNVLGKAFREGDGLSSSHQPRQLGSLARVVFRNAQMHTGTNGTPYQQS